MTYNEFARFKLCTKCGWDGPTAWVQGDMCPQCGDLGLIIRCPQPGCREHARVFTITDKGTSLTCINHIPQDPPDESPEEGATPV